MGHSREDRAQRHDALYATARGDVQEQGGVGAPPPLGLQAPKEKQPRAALGRLPEPERLRGQRIVRSPAAVRRTTGRTCVKSTKSSGSISASGTALSWRTRARMAPVAASPASIQPPNAVTSVGRWEGGSRCKVTSSIRILLAGKRDASGNSAVVPQNPSATWYTQA